MRVEILRKVMISGELIPIGSFIEVDLPTANLLCGMGKAVRAPEPEPTPEPVAPVVIAPEPEPAKPARKVRTPAPLTKD